MVSALLTIVASVATLPWVTSAQSITVEAVCGSSYAWMNNIYGQSPCVVDAYLQEQCSTSDSWDVPALQNGYHYTPPTEVEANECWCNMVTYNLLSACVACQGDNGWPTWHEWIINCTATNTPTYISGNYPYTIPAGTVFPGWAMIDTSVNGWSLAQAESVALGGGGGLTTSVGGGGGLTTSVGGGGNTVPSMTSSIPAPTTSATPTPTSASSPSSSVGNYISTSSSEVLAPSTSSSSSPTSSATGTANSNNSATPVGAIAGGVVGGIAALAIFSLLLFFLMRRSKRNSPVAPANEKKLGQDGYPAGAGYTEGPGVQVPSADYGQSGGPAGNRHTLYDPSNPATYPNSSAATPAPTYHTSTSPPPPSRGSYGYSGVAEV